jgi:hypothetical protein
MTSLEELRIDIPVNLSEVTGTSSASPRFRSRAIFPPPLFHLELLMDDASNWQAMAQVVAIFHTNAGHMTLHDQSYNKDRNIETGNPYKQLIAKLM